MNNQREIPLTLIPICEQAMLNLALNGAKVINTEGKDVTSSLLAQADRINEEYDQTDAGKTKPVHRLPAKPQAPKMKPPAKVPVPRDIIDNLKQHKRGPKKPPREPKAAYSTSTPKS